MAVGQMNIQGAVKMHLRSMTVPRYAAILTTILIILTCGFLTGCDNETSGTFATQIGDQWFTLEIANDKATRDQGLMFREEIANDGGMIFVFDSDQERSFWMKNCLVDIDILYVDRTGHILSAYTMKAQPPQDTDESEVVYENRIRQTANYRSNGKARYVIEMKAGKIRELGLRHEQKLKLDLNRLKQIANKTDDGR